VHELNKGKIILSFAAILSIAITAGCLQKEHSYIAQEQSGVQAPTPTPELESYPQISPTPGIEQERDDQIDEYIKIGLFDYSISETELDLSNAWLEGEHLAHLQYTTNLEVLHLQGNNMSDLGILAGLTNLKYLDLSDNKICDLTPLANLTELKELYLRLNEIVDTIRTHEIRGVVLKRQ